uniref:Uncharacterized protein n=1 Tax=Glossina brevipalpis TaxID=37001 RepID=A0A1A9WJ46_9MUSC
MRKLHEKIFMMLPIDLLTYSWKMNSFDMYWYRKFIYALQNEQEPCIYRYISRVTERNWRFTTFNNKFASNFVRCIFTLKCDVLFNIKRDTAASTRVSPVMTDNIKTVNFSKSVIDMRFEPSLCNANNIDRIHVAVEGDSRRINMLLKFAYEIT